MDRYNCTKFREGLPSCGREARVYPIFLCTTNPDPTALPAEGHLALPVCRRCSHEATIEDIMKLDQFEDLKAAFAEGGLPAPTRGQITLRWWKLDRMPPDVARVMKARAERGPRRPASPAPLIQPAPPIEATLNLLTEPVPVTAEGRVIPIGAYLDLPQVNAALRRLIFQRSLAVDAPESQVYLSLIDGIVHGFDAEKLMAAGIVVLDEQWPMPGRGT